MKDMIVETVDDLMEYVELLEAPNAIVCLDGKPHPIKDVMESIYLGKLKSVEEVRL